MVLRWKNYFEKLLLTSLDEAAEAGKALWFFFLLLIFPRTQGVGDRQTPIKIGKFFSVSLINSCT